MPRRTNPFQQLVYLIQEQVKDRPDTVVTESKMLVNRNTGRRREVDIAVETTVNGVPFTLAVECRKGSRKPTVEWVERMLKKHEYLSDKLVLVANRRFTAEAADLGRREGAETVEAGDATRLDWRARIDQYVKLVFATFDFTLKTFTVEYDTPPGASRFSNDAMVMLTDKWGKSAPLDQAILTLMSDHDQFGKRVMELWQQKPAEHRKPEHTVTLEYLPPADEPMMVSQGTLSYSLKKLVMIVAARVGEAPLDIDHTAYRGVRVAHGSGTMRSGSLLGQTVRFVMTEEQGKSPKAAVMLSGLNGTDRTLVRTALLPADQVVSKTEDSAAERK